jgi:hypothetical protein
MISAVSRTGAEFTVFPLGFLVTLSAGQSTGLSVTLSPVATGWTGGKATFTSNASNPDLRLELEGTGVTSGAVTASPSIVSFGKVAVVASSTLSVALTNARSWRVKGCRPCRRQAADSPSEGWLCP